jgi:hypothetical protein
MLKITIKSTAKKNLNLLNEIKNSNGFIERFNKNIRLRMKDHIDIIKEAVESFSLNNEKINNLYEQVDDEIDEKKLSKTIKNHYKLELKRKQCKEVINENINYLNSFFNALNSMNALSLKEKKYIRDTRDSLNEFVNDENFTVEKINKLSKNLYETTDIVKNGIQEKINSLHQTISDIGNNAAVTINSAGNKKQKQLALEWWNNSINKKQREFAKPKEKLLFFQKIINDTEGTLNNSKLRMEKIIING